MKIMVAGGAGYVGTKLTPALLDRGYDVTVVDNLWFGNYLPQNTTVWERDIFSLTKADLEGFDQVIFLAGLSNDPMAEFSPKVNFVQNAAAPAYLGYVAKLAGVKRFIYAGSCSVYGYTVNELYDEKSPANSNYPYGISKLQGEFSVMQMQDENFSVIAFRKGTVCGFSPRMRLDLVVNTMFKTAMQTGEIVINNPAIWRPVLSIRDAVSAYIRAVEAHQEISGIFNIASGNYTVGEIGDLVKARMEEKLGAKVKLNIKNVQDYRNYKVSYEKAAKILSFKPAYGVEDIVDELIAHLPDMPNLDEDRFYNIRTFKSLVEKNIL